MLFFKKEKARPKKVKVKPEELHEKYHDILGDALNDFEAEVSEMFRSIKESRQEIENLLKELEDAELKNPNVPPKERHFMEGNRLAFSKAVRDFISKLNEPEDIISDETIKKFLEKYREDAENFKKTSLRPGQISSQFFGGIIKKINSQLVSIDNKTKELSEIMKREDVNALSEIKEKIKLMSKEMQKNDYILKQIEQAEKEYEDAKSERAVFEKRIRNLETASSYTKLKEAKEKLKKKEEELKMLDAGFIDNFLQIEKALKKFAKSDDEKFINKYVEDPVSAVLEDSELRIIEILNRTKEALQSGALEIDEKKQEKLAEKLNALDKETFTKFLIDHNGLTLKISELNRLVNQNNSQREIDDNKYKLEHVQQKQQAIGENIKKLNKQMEDLKIEKHKQDIEQGFEKLNAPVDIEL